MEDDRLDIFWIGSLIIMAISNALICIFGYYQVFVGFCIALVAFVSALIAWIVLTIIKVVRLRK
jgi:hypothetical protein